MKCLCPACRRTTVIDAKLLDFFARCERCGVLLRPQRELAERGDRGTSPVKMIAKVVVPGRHRAERPKKQGELASLLLRTDGSTASALQPDQHEDEEILNLLPPKRWSQKRRRRARLQKHHRTLGIIGMCGSGAAAMMAMGAVAAKLFFSWKK